MSDNDPPPEKVRRVKLKRNLSDPTIKLDKPVEVIITGTGGLFGGVLVGKVIAYNSRVFHVQLRDKDGTYVEKYMRKSGIRVEDIGDSLGRWQIDPTCLDKVIEAPPVPSEEEIPHFQLLSREELPYPGDPSDKIVLEIWEDMDRDIHYFKSYRTGPVGDGKLKRPAQLPCVVPFTVLRQVLYDYESRGDDDTLGFV